MSQINLHTYIHTYTQCSIWRFCHSASPLNSSFIRYDSASFIATSTSASLFAILCSLSDSSLIIIHNYHPSPSPFSCGSPAIRAATGPISVSVQNLQLICPYPNGPTGPVSIFVPNPWLLCPYPTGPVSVVVPNPFSALSVSTGFGPLMKIG